MKKCAILTLALITGGAAWAQTAQTPQGQQNREAAREFTTLDVDKDGYLSEKELRGKRGLSIPRADLNGDGRIEFAEFAQFEENVSVEFEDPQQRGGAKSAPGAGAQDR